jgi:hypothetical protein
MAGSASHGHGHNHGLALGYLTMGICYPYRLKDRVFAGYHKVAKIGIGGVPRKEMFLFMYSMESMMMN